VYCSAVVPVIYTSREDPEEKLCALKRFSSCTNTFCLLLLCQLLAVVPVIYTSREDPEEKLRALKRSMGQQQQDAKGFAAASSAAAAQQSSQEPGPSGSGIGNSEVSLTEQDRKWRLEPSAVTEWEVS
jgi:hypothetical protein